METWGYSLISVVLVSVISLVGILLLLLRRDVGRMTFLLVSFAVGGLFGDAFIHLLPESFESFDNALVPPLLVLAGILLFFGMEKVLRWHHHHQPDSETHLHPVVTMNLVGDAAHNFVDGMILGATYLVSVPLGLTTTLAILLHEIPQEMGDFGILVHGGLSVRRALLFNFLSAIPAIVGTVLSLAVGPHVAGYSSILVPITAGGFIYIAGSDLIPELHRDVSVGRSLLQFGIIILGLAVMAALTLIE